MTSKAAGRMKAAPPNHNPHIPARRYPRCIAISVEFGPGIKWVAPSRSRNSSEVTHPRFRTVSDSINAMCAAGPPKAVAPKRRKRRTTSIRARHGSGWVSPRRITVATSFLKAFWAIRLNTRKVRHPASTLLLRHLRSLRHLHPSGCRRHRPCLPRFFPDPHPPPIASRRPPSPGWLNPLA